MIERYRPCAACAPSARIPRRSRVDSVPSFGRPVIPTDINAYFDKVQFWRPTPLDAVSRAWLRSQCRTKGLYADRRRPARFDARLRERIEVRGISSDGLTWIASQSGILINRIEVAIDYSFESVRDLDEAFEFFHRSLVRRYHGRNQEIRFVRGKDGQAWVEHDIRVSETRYDAGRFAPHVLVLYKQKYSRVTGEVAPVLHLEWRANGRRAVRSIGIDQPADLLCFDHRAFWVYRLLLQSISAQRLGRLYRNYRNGTKSRISTNVDGQYGEILLRASGRNMQQLLDEYGKRYPIKRVLENIPNDAWLPTSSWISSL